MLSLNAKQVKSNLDTLISHHATQTMRFVPLVAHAHHIALGKIYDAGLELMPETQLLHELLKLLQTPSSRVDRIAQVDAVVASIRYDAKQAHLEQTPIGCVASGALILSRMVIWESKKVNNAPKTMVAALKSACSWAAIANNMLLGHADVESNDDGYAIVQNVIEEMM